MSQRKKFIVCFLFIYPVCEKNYLSFFYNGKNSLSVFFNIIFIIIVEQDTIQMTGNQTTNNNEKTKYLRKLQNQRRYLKSKLKQNTIQRNTRAIQLKVSFN